jgi:hypothetical protein
MAKPAAGVCIVAISDKDRQWLHENGVPPDEEAEIARIMALSDEEVWREHVALYGGDEKLAHKAVDMMQARIQRLLGETAKH